MALTLPFSMALVQMVCKPPFEVELSKGDGKILALQCSFPSQDQMFEDAQSQDAEQIGMMFWFCH